MASRLDFVLLVLSALAFFSTQGHARLTKRHSLGPTKPILTTYPRDVVANTFTKRQVEREGVFHLPLVRSNHKSASRNQLRRRDAEEIPVDFDNVAIEVAVDGQTFKYAIQINSDIVVGYNAEDSGEAWQPDQDKDATASGNVVTNAYKSKAQEYTFKEFTVGSTTLQDLVLLYADPNDKVGSGEPVGDIGLGLPGSNAFKDTSATSYLQSISENNAWSQPIFSFAFGRGQDEAPSKLVLGAESPSTSGTAPFWSSSQGDRWALPVTINGHSGTADLATNTGYIITPPDVATDLINSLGLTPSTDDQGDVVSRFDCTQQIPDILIDLEGGTLQFTSDSSGIPDDDGKMCTLIVKGVDQGSYPTPYSLGLIAFTNFNIAFDFTPGSPKIGFAPLSA